MSAEAKLDNVLYTLVASFTVTLNAVEIFLLCKKWNNLKNFEQLLLSLAVSDIIAGLIVLIFGITDAIAPFPDIGGNVFLRVLGASFVFSLSSLLVISIDRMAAVRFPLKHKIWMTRYRMKWIILCMWITVVGVTIIEICLYLMLQKDRNSRVMFFFRNVPWVIFSSVVVFAALYAYIVYVGIKQGKINTAPNNLCIKNGKAACVIRKIKKQQPIIITSSLVVVSYVVCTLPFAIEALCVKEDNPIDDFGVLFFANTAIDPIVYFFKGLLERKYKDNKQKQRGH